MYEALRYLDEGTRLGEGLDSPRDTPLLLQLFVTFSIGIYDEEPAGRSYVCMTSYIYMPIYIYIYMPIYIYICQYIYANIYTHTHTHI